MLLKKDQRAIVSKFDTYGWQPVHYAAYLNKMGLISLLIEVGCGVFPLVVCLNLVLIIWPLVPCRHQSSSGGRLEAQHSANAVALGK